MSDISEVNRTLNSNHCLAVCPGGCPFRVCHDSTILPQPVKAAAGTRLGHLLDAYHGSRYSSALDTMRNIMLMSCLRDHPINLSTILLLRYRFRRRGGLPESAVFGCVVPRHDSALEHIPRHTRRTGRHRCPRKAQCDHAKALQAKVSIFTF